MIHRIAIWATTGFVVVCCWAAYMAVTFPEQLTSVPILWTLAGLTCPIVFVSVYWHFGVALPWVLAANTATYALVGLMVETLRGRLSPAR
jgi:hypothetical protein